MKYGIITTREAYHDGKLASKRVERSIPKMISTKAEALTEMMEALDTITNKETRHITIELEADLITGNLKKITIKHLIQ
jgi:hypothetical protein